MQVAKRQLLRQQVILTGLGFYTGPLDGIWGPQCIEAMKKFEMRRDLFKPARPVNGLPFGDNNSYPRGVMSLGGKEPLLYHKCVDDLTEREDAAWQAICAPKEKAPVAPAPQQQEPEALTQASTQEPGVEVEKPVNQAAAPQLRQRDDRNGQQRQQRR